MIPEQRREFIYRYVHEKNIVSIKDLTELMDVSHMTIRRDIQILETEGKVVSINGGIRLNERLMLELAYEDKAALNHKIKKHIGQLAATMVEPGLTIYLDAGTTLLEIAHMIVARNLFNLTVVTNDYTICNYLMDKPYIQLYHTGGLVDQRNHSSIGNIAAQFFNSVNIDIAFLSSSSWDIQRGLSTPHEGKAIVKKAVLQAARRRILACDSSKYGKYSMFHVCHTHEFTDIICDQLPDDVPEQIRSIGVQLHLTQLKQEAAC